MTNERIAWSISRLFDFEVCAYRLFLKVIKKSPQPELADNHPMIRGRCIHEEVEEYIAGRTEDFPSSGKKLKHILDECREQYSEGTAQVEEKWGFTEEWGITGWWDKDIWLRMATDYWQRPEPDVGLVYDWKTGKSFGNEVKYMQQMQLYACGAFMRWPELEYLDVSLGFLDDGQVRTKNFRRDDKIPKLVSRFTSRAQKLTDNIDWRPRPNAMNCKYCPFGTANGTGVCVYAAETL